MDIEILKLLLEQQLDIRKIGRGTKKAYEFEQTFLIGAISVFAARNEEPPVFLVMCAMSSRSLLETCNASEEVH